MQRLAMVMGLCLASVFFPGTTWGQAEGPFLQFNFSRQNDFTFSTQFNSWYSLQKGRYSMDLRLTHTNVYNTSLEKDRFVQLYLKSSLWQYYKLNKKLDIASWVETAQYFNNHNEKVHLYAGVRYKPYSFLTITPLVGYAWDARTAILGQSVATAKLDQGFTPALVINAAHAWEDNLEMRTRAIARYKFIDPRRQYNVSFFHAWSKKFQDGVTLDVGTRMGSHELDDYQSNSVKRIVSDSIYPHLNLAYEFAKGIEWRSENEFLLSRRQFKFENQIAETAEANNLTFDGLEISTRQRLSIARERWRGYVNYEYAFSSRNYDLDNNVGLNRNDFQTLLEREKQKDFIKSYHRLEFLYDVKAGKRHRLKIQLNNQYLQYDTPSELNYDDRDELSWLGSTELVSRWRRSLFTGLTFSANYRHYAFLLKEKSQDNYKQRSLRMDFRFGWDIGKEFRLEGENAAYVTYNVKDFADYNKTNRSTRNLETNMRLYYRPSQNFQAEAGINRKETQQSYLNWEAFSETTLDTIVRFTALNQYRRYFKLQKGKSRLFIEGGYKHFDQVRKFRAPFIGLDNLLRTVSLRQITSQTGPLLKLGYRDRRQSTLDFGLWMQIQVRRARWQELGSEQILGQAYYERELNQVSTEVRPYVTIRLNYFFK